MQEVESPMEYCLFSDNFVLATAILNGKDQHAEGRTGYDQVELNDVSSNAELHLDL